MNTASRTDRIFQVINYLILVVVMLVCLLPFLNILAKSFSNETSVLAGDISFWPTGFNLKAYNVVFGSYRFWDALFVSIFITVAGTAINTLLTIFASYSLSRTRLKFRRFFTFLYIFTMLFNGGIIPTYLVIRHVGLINSVWSLIIPTLVMPFNMIILRNYFYNVPDSLEESAKMDGALNVRILFSIMIPLAMPAVATIMLFYAVGYWNNYFEALMYINNRKLFPLQIYLRELILNTDTNKMNMSSLMHIAQESVRGATIIAATLPILAVYPFLQKYFVKGVMLGSVKQ